jgi:hypothetical protein
VIQLTNGSHNNQTLYPIHLHHPKHPPWPLFLSLNSNASIHPTIGTVTFTRLSLRLFLSNRILLRESRYQRGGQILQSQEHHEHQSLVASSAVEQQTSTTSWRIPTGDPTLETRVETLGSMPSKHRLLERVTNSTIFHAHMTKELLGEQRSCWP